MGCRDQRDDAAAGAEIEEAPSVGPHRQIRKRHGGAVHTGNVVGRRLLTRAETDVRRDEQLIVRHDPHRRTHHATVGARDPKPSQVRHTQRRDRRRNVVLGNVEVQHEETDQRCQATPALEATKLHRNIPGA